LSSETIHMSTVSFEGLWRLRPFLIRDLGERGLSPKSGNSNPSGLDSSSWMGMGPGSSGMMPLCSIPWWTCLALSCMWSMSSDTRLPGSEPKCDHIGKNGEREREREMEKERGRRRRGGERWGERWGERGEWRGGRERERERERGRYE